MAIEEIAAGFFTLDQRLSSFEVSHPLPGRRTSKRASKASAKSASKSLNWPHKSLAPEQLAKAGFFYHPLPESPDNTACFLCHRQIDGWEEDDDPLVEHLKHSPECAWAIIATIEVNEGVYGQEQLSSKDMLDARKATFANRWPHDAKRGWKCKTKQLAEAGWHFAPVDDSDMAVCAFCHLALDGWEQKDIPRDEHYRRSPGCTFFTIPAPSKQTKRTSKARQSRMTTASAASPASSVGSLAVGQKRRSDIFEEPPAKKRRNTRSKVVASPIERTPTPEPEPELELEPSPSPEPEHESEHELEPEPEPEPELEPSPSPVPEKTYTPVIARSSTPQDTHSPEMARSPTPEQNNTPVVAISPAPEEDEPVAPVEPKPTRQEFNTPSQSPRSSNAENKPPNNGLQSTNPWTAIDMDAVFVGADSTVPPKGGELSSVEKGMTVEQWIRYNAELAEDQLKTECERMVSTFENQGTKAMKTLEGIECIRT
ncbi:hypothetical protein HYALB_00011639 [Hymenoscyphus albidus]|uniref:Protein bir1 n=1 Tax=Hymenoscyphus albidus TaxID=595503 RepID=A0A9N9Q454_9HELO|nr:hypothetical protein HYALB_00011639 [Hymenoscyphus albidus]